MHFLAISGSARVASTTTAMLRALKTAVDAAHDVAIFDRVHDLPVFSPDLEAPRPAPVAAFAEAVEGADGLIFASPEYVRSLPGGLKNAIDWLVSGEELVRKPIALAHASHRGDDMLQQLRIVLGTVSARVNERLFLRFPLMKLSPDEVARTLSLEGPQADMRKFLNEFAAFCRTV